nr:hypothetical protein [Kibdelosporangium sp. MJ126-NF4]
MVTNPFVSDISPRRIQRPWVKVSRHARPGYPGQRVGEMVTCRTSTMPEVGMIVPTIPAERDNARRSA